MGESQTLNVAIVGGGPGCKAIMDMMLSQRLSQLRMRLIGVACTDTTAVGYGYAQEQGICTTRDYRDLYALEDLGMIIELTGRDEVAIEISRTKPEHVRLIDHVAARLFWDIFQIEEERLRERAEAEGALRESARRVRVAYEQSLSYAEDLRQEIAERRRAEERLRESEDKYRELFNNAQVGLFRTRTRDGKILECNERFGEMFGYESREACLHDFVASEHYLDPGTRERMLQEMQEKGEVSSFEARMSRKDGSVIWIRYSARLHPEKDCLEGVAADISEEKLATRAVEQAKEDWERTFDAIGDMVMLLDSEHRIVRINKAAARALNIPKEKLVGKKCYEAMHGQARPIPKCPLKKTMRTLDPHTEEISEPRLGGVFICATSPILNGHGQVAGYTHTLKDITQWRRLEAQFQHAQKLEAIGTLAGGIAHDFNNLLMSIQGNASLMYLDIDASHPHHERLRIIEKQIESGARLTSHLLGYARKGKYAARPLDLNLLVEETSDTFGRTRKDIMIHVDLAADLSTIEADPGQIEQVLLNLFVNAGDAMPGGGTLTLKTRNTTESHMKGDVYEPRSGEYVLLTVVDTGTGMEKETQQRIFDPFFTTKEMGRGTGLGLASAYGIIKNHGGYIDVTSEKGQGSIFNIYLPASRKRALQLVKSAMPVVQGNGTILLADDEGDVLDIGKEMLETMGYKVLTARDGKEAVQVFRENKTSIDLVLLDLVMPKMAGGEAFDRIKEIEPKAKVMLASGYTVDGEATDILNRGCDGFIQKPFDVEVLSTKISEILNGEWRSPLPGDPSAFSPRPSRAS